MLFLDVGEAVAVAVDSVAAFVCQRIHVFPAVVAIVSGRSLTGRRSKQIVIGVERKGNAGQARVTELAANATGRVRVRTVLVG
jgi:hypothetical protein